MSILACCATPSGPASKPPPAIEPKAVDPRLCADLKGEPPVQGALVAPATEAERVELQQFLEGEATARDWGREGWQRAALARRLCGPGGKLK